MEHGDSQIRPAEAGDAPAAAECVQRAYAHYVERIGLAPMPMLDDYRAVINEKQVFVLDSGERIIGLIVLEVTEEGFLLGNVAVDPQQQGKGFGKLLLQFAEDEAIRHGFDAIYLYTNVKMTENQAIYTARGYVEYDRRVVNGRDGIFMRKKIKNAGD